MQNAAFSKIYQQEPIIISFRKIPKHETRLSQDGAVDSAGTLQPKSRIFLTQFQEIDVKIVKLAIFLPLRKVEFAP
jgi:hypothetical protein